VSVVRIHYSGRFTDREKYFLFPFALVGILVLSRFIDPNSMPEICIFKMVSGVPSKFYGLSHAFHAINNGNFQDAVGFHPLAFVAYGVVVILTIFSLFRIFLWDKLGKFHGIEEKILKFTSIFFTFFWLYRIISGELL
jgi:hypothetical protein